MVAQFTRAFIKYVNTAGACQLEVPEGWARKLGAP
jgi:hypothetical protein